LEDRGVDTEFDKPGGLAVPSGRLARLSRFGGLAGGLAGNVAAEGARRLARGERPVLRDLLLTPGNATRVADQLAHLRGAAMKVGQLMSMEAGDVLPPELTAILARLRDDAQTMPPRQLKTVLAGAWGRDFPGRFARFDIRPVAAASIGQVHRAVTRDGRDLAIKVQYPGVRRSIASDVDNVATLIRLSGLVPAELDLRPLLDEAKRQLHEEADYVREAACLTEYAAALGDDPDFAMPAVQPDLTTADVLAMTYVEGVPLEARADAPQAERDRIATLMIDLTLREIFAFGLIQSDPNFANYRYAPETGRVVLLDFGATRRLDPGLVDDFRDLLRAGLADDREAVRRTAIRIGYFDDATAPHHQAALLDMFEMSMEPLRQTAPFDFARSDLAIRLRDAGLAFGEARDFWHIPPMDALYVQRKVAGMYLLAARLKARVDIAPLARRYA